MATLRTAVLDAFLRLELRHGRKVFALTDIVQETSAGDPTLKEASVRTHVTSVMCREAPVHHHNHTNDLERVGRGLYRRIVEWPEEHARSRTRLRRQV